MDNISKIKVYGAELPPKEKFLSSGTPLEDVFALMGAADREGRQEITNGIRRIICEMAEENHSIDHSGDPNTSLEVIGKLLLGPYRSRLLMFYTAFVNEKDCPSEQPYSVSSVHANDYSSKSDKLDTLQGAADAADSLSDNELAMQIRRLLAKVTSEVSREVVEEKKRRTRINKLLNSKYLEDGEYFYKKTMALFTVQF